MASNLKTEMRKFLLGYLRVRNGPASAGELHAVFKEVFGPIERQPGEVRDDLDALLAEAVVDGNAVLGYSIHSDHAG